MPRQVHAQERILGSLLAKVMKEIDPGSAQETNAQMHGTLGRHSGGMRLAARDEKHVPRRQLELLIRHTRIDLCAISYFDRMRHLHVPDAPLLVSMNLHNQDVHEVPMRLERAA